MDAKKIALYLIIILIVLGLGSYFYISGNSHHTKIDVVSQGTLKNGDLVRILLTDEYRNVYPNETINVKILDDTGWANKYQLVTGEDGIASVKLEAYENGNYTIHSDYNGTLFNQPYHSVDKLVINDGYN